MKTLVIWAHSECKSNARLLCEVKSLAESRGFRVFMCLWDLAPMPESRKVHALKYLRIGNDIDKGRAVISSYGGKDAIHVFSVYQNSPVWRKLIVEAKSGGARVVVSAEAPCEMCVGLKACLKRAYYRFILPLRVGCVARSADLFLNASGKMGLDRLVRLGWTLDKIVPFGYASDIPLGVRRDDCCVCRDRSDGRLHILHTGIEAKYRDVATLKKAVRKLRLRGIEAELRCTGGALPADDLARLYGWADVLAACGLCEPWGMRVNDAIHAGLPVVVSSGMGSRLLVERFGCGRVFRLGDADSLADALSIVALDEVERCRMRLGANAAHRAWSPVERAKVWLDAVEGV